jgi:hypothetical protein
MYSRRQFLISSTNAGAGLILPSYYDKVLSFIENHGEPLLEAPARFDDTLYAERESDYQLNLGKPVYDLPEMTWREAIERYDLMPDASELEDEFGITVADLDNPVDWDWQMERWCRKDSPNARAFHLLDGLNIGTDLQHGDLVGGLTYHDGPCPGSDYLAVHAECDVSLSLLQHRLNELNTGIKVVTL